MHAALDQALAPMDYQSAYVVSTLNTCARHTQNPSSIKCLRIRPELLKGAIDVTDTLAHTVECTQSIMQASTRSHKLRHIRACARAQIVDDWILAQVVMPLPEDVYMFCVMDCCHSGSIMDLPYEIVVTPELAAKASIGARTLARTHTRESACVRTHTPFGAGREGLMTGIMDSRELVRAFFALLANIYLYLALW